MKENSTEETYKVLRGYTYYEITELVSSICIEAKIPLSSIIENSEFIDSKIRKYGWTIADILRESGERNRGMVDERYG